MVPLLIIAGLVMGIGLIAGRKTVRRFFAPLGAQLNKLGRLVWGFDPVAVYQKQVDDATDEIRSGTRGLEQHRGHVTQLQRKVDTAKKEIAQLQARAEGYVREGNDARAAGALTEKKRLEAELATASASLATCEEAYQNNLRKIQFAQRKIEEAKRVAQRLQADLRLSQAEREIAKLNTNFIASSIDGLGEVRDEIQRQIDANRAVAQVQTDLGNNEMADMEAEDAQRKADAADELATLKAKMSTPSVNSR